MTGGMALGRLRLPTKPQTLSSISRIAKELKTWLTEMVKVLSFKCTVMLNIAVRRYLELPSCKTNYIH
jgi:hypothetical protein